MSILSSRVRSTDPEFAENRTSMLAMVDEIRTLEALVRAHGERARGKFVKREQLMPRERVQQLLDPGTCLLYTSPSPRDGLLSRMPSSA